MRNSEKTPNPTVQPEVKATVSKSEPTQKPTVKPTEKATEKPTQTPTNPPTEAPTYPPTEASVPVEKTAAYSAYADVLSTKSGGRFSLIYIDEDNIAELAFFEGNGAHADQDELYTYYSGKAVTLGKVGSYGTIAYSEYNNRIFGYTGLEPNPDLEAKYTYKIENGELVNGFDGQNYEITTAYVDDGIKNEEYTRSKLAVDGL